jgi:hypothetical protein
MQIFIFIAVSLLIFFAREKSSLEGSEIWGLVFAFAAMFSLGAE